MLMDFNKKIPQIQFREGRMWSNKKIRQHNAERTREENSRKTNNEFW